MPCMSEHPSAAQPMQSAGAQELMYRRLLAMTKHERMGTPHKPVHHECMNVQMHDNTAHLHVGRSALHNQDERIEGQRCLAANLSSVLLPTSSTLVADR